METCAAMSRLLFGGAADRTAAVFERFRLDVPSTARVEAALAAFSGVLSRHVAQHKQRLKEAREHVDLCRN